MLRSISLCRHASANTPAEPWGASVARFPHDGGLPRFDDGSASASTFRGLLGVHSRSGLPARRTAQGSPLHRSASADSLPPPPLRLLPAGATLAGRELHPLKIAAFSRRTSEGGPFLKETCGDACGAAGPLPWLLGGATKDVAQRRLSCPEQGESAMGATLTCGTCGWLVFSAAVCSSRGARGKAVCGPTNGRATSRGARGVRRSPAGHAFLVSFRNPGEEVSHVTSVRDCAAVRTCPER